ncbi:hypothetical protein RB597_004509 [Gaeumannomyces tritici]
MLSKSQTSSTSQAHNDIRPTACHSTRPGPAMDIGIVMEKHGEPLLKSTSYRDRHQREDGDCGEGVPQPREARSHNELPRQPSSPRPPRPELTVKSLREPDADEEEFDGDQDDAQSLFQPAISPVATRLTLPKTPAAEKAAAMDQALDGFFGPLGAILETAPAAPDSRVASTTFLRLPDTPRQDSAAAGAPGKPSALASVLGDSRHRRASSVGSDALKRLSKALPSISLPTGFFPTLSTPSFFSSSSSSTPNRPDAPPRSPSRLQEQLQIPAAPLKIQAAPPQQAADHVRPPRPLSVRSYRLQRSTSAESVLFATLSRVSSFGDDERFGNVREQVNSRLKAVLDSFDRPSFKMPQLPNLISSASFIRDPSSIDGAFAQNQASPSVPASLTAAASRDGLPMLDAVLETLVGDIVVLGGYRGSVLRSTAAPQPQVWIPMKVGLNMRKVNLEVGLNPEDEEGMEDVIFPSAMLQNIGPVDISRRLLRRMRESPNARAGKLRVHEFAYDWRLSPARSSARMVRFLEGLRCNSAGTPKDQRGALVLAHSLGGMITRHAVNQRPELFSGVGYIGVPQRAINILGPLRNGDAVLLNEKVLTANVTFSFRTSFVFLPEDGFCFVSKDMKESYKVDFYDADSWVKHKLCPVVDPTTQVTKTTGKRNSALVSLRDLTSTLSTNLPLRGRSGSEANANRKPAEAVKERVLAPQLDSSSTAGSGTETPAKQNPSTPPEAGAEDQCARSYEYLKRTLAETKQFRAETQHVPALSEANAYPPMAVMYGKDTPTVYAVRVASRDVIAGPEVYDDLVFRSGDGVVLAREAMLPHGFHVVRGGRVSTEKGHISMLGDFPAVARVLEALLRGRRKGIGLGGSSPAAAPSSRRSP